jgi:hypothetical protein
MTNKQYDNSFLGLFKGIHKKVLNLLTFLLVSVIGISTTIGIIDSQISDTQKKSWENIKPLISEIKNSLFATIIMIFFFEIGLRQESLEEIRKLFEETQPSKYISNFYPNHDQFNSEIIKSIAEATPCSDINLLGVHKEMSVFENPGIKKIKEKMQSGCHFKIIISHPDSSVITSLETLKPQNTRGILIERLRSLKTSLHDELLPIFTSLNGSIEIKLHKNVFVPVCYYSAPGLTAVWMYLPDKSGIEFPGFVVSDQELLSNMNNYFDHLWDKSDTLLLVKKDYEEFNSNLIPSSSSPQSVVHSSAIPTSNSSQNN